MGNQIQGQDINLRNCRQYYCCLEFGAAGAYLGYYGEDIRVVRLAAGSYNIILPVRPRRLLYAGVTNGASATAFVDDTTVATTGIINATFTEPVAPRRVYIRLMAPTDDFNARR